MVYFAGRLAPDRNPDHTDEAQIVATATIAGSI
jgi:hypothetical protein